jgi:hypothetical protein
MIQKTRIDTLNLVGRVDTARSKLAIMPEYDMNARPNVVSRGSTGVSG